MSAYLSWPAGKFSQVFGSMLVAASKDSDHPAFCSVHVSRADTKLTVEATDGHWMLRWRETEGTSDDNGVSIERKPFTVDIPRRVIEDFLAAIRNPLELEHVRLLLVKTPFTLETILDTKRHEFLPTPEQFPSMDGIVPSDGKQEGTGAALGAGILSRVSKAFARVTDDKDCPILFQMTGGPDAPVICTTPFRTELLAVVMPVKSEQ
jgi:hypothetical protein